MGNRIKNKRFINLGGSSTEETTQNETASETSVETETIESENESINLIRPLEENMFYKIFNSTSDSIKDVINNYVPGSLMMKILFNFFMEILVIIINEKQLFINMKVLIL